MILRPHQIAPAFHRPRIKPTLWGSVSDVRAAIRRNCDRIGIPHPKAFYAPPWIAGGAILDLIGNCHCVMATGSAAPTIVNGGQMVYFDGTDDYAKTSSLPVGIDLSGYTWTVFCSLIPVQAYTNAHPQFFGYSTFSTSGYQRQIGIQTYYIPSIRSYTYLTSSDDYAQNLTSTYDGSILTAACVSSGTTSHPSYLNGGLIGTSTETVDSNYNHIDIIAIGARFESDLQSGAAFDAGYFDLGCVFQGALSAEQNRVLHENRYALLQPTPRILYFDVAAGGGTLAVSTYESTIALNESIGQSMELGGISVHDCD